MSFFGFGKQFLRTIPSSSDQLTKHIFYKFIVSNVVKQLKFEMDRF